VDKAASLRWTGESPVATWAVLAVAASWSRFLAGTSSLGCIDDPRHPPFREVRDKDGAARLVEARSLNWPHASNSLTVSQCNLCAVGTHITEYTPKFNGSVT